MKKNLIDKHLNSFNKKRRFLKKNNLPFLGTQSEINNRINSFSYSQLVKMLNHG